MKTLHDIQPRLTPDILSRYDGSHLMEFLKVGDRVENHTRDKIISLSLFDSNVNAEVVDPDTFSAKNDWEYFNTKYLSKFRGLIGWIEEHLPEYGIELFVEQDLYDNTDFVKNSEIINSNIMERDSVAAFGMYWRFLPFNWTDREHVMVADIDVDTLDIHQRHLNCGTCRYSSESKYSQFLIDNDPNTTNGAKSYMLICGSAFSIQPKDVLIDMPTAICQFMDYQEKACPSEDKTDYNKPIGNFRHGFGNNPYNYASDERFLSKVMFYHLAERGLMKTFKTGRHPVQEETMIDMNYCLEFGNEFHWV